MWPSEPNLYRVALLSSPTQVPDLSLAKSFICDRYNLSKNNFIITLVSQSHNFWVLYWHMLENLETTFDIFYFNAPLFFRILVVPLLAFAKSFPRSLLPQSSTLPFSLLILARKLCVKSRTNPTTSLLKNLSWLDSEYRRRSWTTNLFLKAENLSCCQNFACHVHSAWNTPHLLWISESISASGLRSDGTSSLKPSWILLVQN